MTEPRTDGAAARTLTPESVSATREGQPDKLRRKLKGDIDNIVLMAMRKEPHRRYESAEQLSDDLRRHLLDLPVIARKDTFRYRGSKFFNRNRTSVLSAAVVALFSLIIGTSLFLLTGHPTPVDSVAVLPFVNAGGDAGDYLSDGITDNLIDGVSHLPGLKVASRSSVARYLGKEMSLQSIGRDLKVDVVLRGSVIEQGDNLIVKAELFDVGKNRNIWSKEYNRSVSGIVALQEEILRYVAEGLRVKLSGREETLRRKRYTDNTEAYQAYLKGRYFWTRRTPDSLKKGIEFFQQAAKLDPDYALAYAGLADSYIVLSFIERPADAFSKAEENAFNALRIDDTLAEAHTSLAQVKELSEHDWLTAENEYKRALELNPDYVTAHLWYADFLRLTKRSEEAFDELTAAQQIDPLSLIVNANLAIHFYLTRQYDRAIDQSKKTLDMEPHLAAPHFVLASAYAQKKMYGEAIAEYQKAISLGSGFPALGGLGKAYADSGNKVEAQKVLERLIASSKERYVPSYAMAPIFAALGEKDEAFKWLEKGMEEHSPWMVANLPLAPDFDSLRSDPRFNTLLQRMNLLP